MGMWKGIWMFWGACFLAAVVVVGVEEAITMMVWVIATFFLIRYVLFPLVGISSALYETKEEIENVKLYHQIEKTEPYHKYNLDGSEVERDVEVAEYKDK